MSERGQTRSALTVGSGLAVLGVSASVYLVLAGRSTGPAGFAGLAVQWTLVYTVAVGCFVPFEQEVARAVAESRARGVSAAPLLRRAVRLAGLLWVAQLVLVLATLPWLFETLWFGSVANVVGLLLASAGLAAQYLQRGVLSGSQSFGPYAAQLAAEGVTRTVGTIALVVAGVHDPAPYALLVGVSPIVSVLAVTPPVRRVTRAWTGGTDTHRRLAQGLGWLLLAALAAQGLANLGTVAVRVLGDALPVATVSHFMSGLTVARLPLFAFAAIQAVLLPALAAAVARRSTDEFRRRLLVTLACTAAVAGLGVLGALVLGPEVLRLLFGPAFDLPRRDVTLLALGSGVYMLALVLQPAVIALRGYLANAVSWTTGVLVFLAALALPGSVFLRVEVALLAGGVAAVAVLALSVRLLWTGHARQAAPAETVPPVEVG